MHIKVLVCLTFMQISQNWILDEVSFAYQNITLQGDICLFIFLLFLF